MNKNIFCLIIVLLIADHHISGQDTIPGSYGNDNEKTGLIYGFIRGGTYYDLNRKSTDPFLSSAYADLGLKIESGKQGIYHALADVRFRYGSEFNKQANSITIREGYVEAGSKLKMMIGQKILKWGRADFTNPTSKFNPQNFISRSPDREDMDMGNILGTISWYPSDVISFQAVAAPFYMPSTLIIDPVPLPENTTIEMINGLITDQQLPSYGLRSDIHLTGIDFGLSWFKGYDPMPGIELTSFALDLSGPVPVPTTILAERPYETQVFGLDFETSIGPLGFRGEAAWSFPTLSYDTCEYVPMEEIKWVAGLDWLPGNWKITLEYSGKYIPKFVAAATDPIIGTEPDLAKLAEMLMIPGFDINEYVRQQVGTFNRLYNYQLEEYYHSAGLRVETDLFYGRLLPSVFTLYNFTSKDLLLIPEIRFKPTDGITIVAGTEFYSGTKGSLFDIVNDFMNTVYIGFKVDF